ncbi:amino acid transporter [Holzapfeliella floricola DSM 23037 = JCM 16512]|uniref:Amino acid transporter n=2 Tax=Holzapfeliella TaxID=2767883 RepID=A0A0R2DMT5_9LACO|nr:amino acid permease [Holzapfeliella floricola]KRN04475.1 amino acid transporter [Holzapfeliella floricola DSM 23037 = JCM 16512]
MSQEMKKNLKFSQALSTVMGIVIGSGIFFKIASITQLTQSTSMTIFVWLFAGVLSIASGLTVAELATALPVTGGPIKYIEYTYGKPLSFLYGWAQILIYFPASIASLMLVFSQQLTALLGINHQWIIPLAVLCLLSVALINFIGNKASGILQVVSLVIKLIPVALIVIVGLIHDPKVPVDLFPITAGENVPFFVALSGGLLSAMYAYEGWINVGNIAGELKRPSKDLPKAIILGLSLVTVIYVLINFAFLSSLPIEQLAGNPNAAFDSSRVLFGNLGGRLVTIGILVSVYGTINGFVMTGMRLPYTLAQSNQLPFSQHLKKLNRFGVPMISGLLICGISILLLFLGNFDNLTNMLVFVMWTFTTLISIAVLILRKREPELERPYKVLFYPIIPIISILGGGFIVIATFITQFQLSIIGVLVTLTGLPVYYYYHHKNKA